MYLKTSSSKELSVDKLKGLEDEGKYIFTLEEKYRKIAEVELGETDEVREAALKQMRSWIINNNDIEKCRTDNLFLLRFLRVCKFNVPRACSKLENFLKIHQDFPEWFENVSIHDCGIRYLIEAGYVVALPERDSYGRLVLFYDQKYLDPEKSTITDLMRMAELVFQMFFDDERTQIAGHIWVYDDSASTLKHLRQWSLDDIKHGIKYISKGMPIRSKGYVRVNMAQWMIVFSDIIKPFLAEKIKNRFHFPRNFDKIDGIDKKILPKEYGGTIPHQEMVKEFLKFAEQFQDECLLQNKMKIRTNKKGNERKNKKLKNENHKENLNHNFKDLQLD